MSDNLTVQERELWEELVNAMHSSFFDDERVKQTDDAVVQAFADAIMPLIQRHSALLVAGVYEKATQLRCPDCRNNVPIFKNKIGGWFHRTETYMQQCSANDIRALTPADAVQALAERDKEVAAAARLDEHLRLCPKCTRKTGHVIGVRCADAVALERAATQRGEGVS